jgi:hypothetical protein
MNFLWTFCNNFKTCGALSLIKIVQDNMLELIHIHPKFGDIFHKTFCEYYLVKRTKNKMHASLGIV